MNPLTLFRNFFAPPRHMILLVAAAWIGLTLAEKRSEQSGIRKEDINNLIFYGLVGFVLGGRIAFIAQNASAFIKSPFGIVSINPDLFDPLGGLAAAILVGLIYGQRLGLAFWNTLDALTPFFAVLALGLGLSRLADGTAFGKATSLPWGIELWNETRHPTQIYEALASLVILGLLWFKKQDSTPGLLFLTFACLTAGAQLFIQAFRAEGTFILNGLRQGQVLAWLVLAVCFILIETRLAKSANG